MSPYVTPSIGTVLPPQPNTDIPNPGPTHELVAMNRWLQAQAQQTAWQQNQVKVEDYTNHFLQSWLPNYQSGRLKGPTGIVGDPAAAPPEPPAAAIVLVTGNETGGITFDVQPSGLPAYDEYLATGPYIPVCDVPSYKLIRAPGQ